MKVHMNENYLHEQLKKEEYLLCVEKFVTWVRELKRVHVRPSTAQSHRVYELTRCTNQILRSGANLCLTSLRWLLTYIWFIRLNISLRAPETKLNSQYLGRWNIWHIENEGPKLRIEN